MAVWIVIWRHPTILAPFKGCDLPYFVRRAMRPGISSSDTSISLRPKAARPMSATLYLRAGVDMLYLKERLQKRESREIDVVFVLGI
jgi:hypothetical protein